eukprot:3400358-Rhodomonas_salina.2
MRHARLRLLRDRRPELPESRRVAAVSAGPPSVSHLPLQVGVLPRRAIPAGHSAAHVYHPPQVPCAGAGAGQGRSGHLPPDAALVRPVRRQVAQGADRALGRRGGGGGERGLCGEGDAQEPSGPDVQQRVQVRAPDVRQRVQGRAGGHRLPDARQLPEGARRAERPRRGDRPGHARRRPGRQRHLGSRGVLCKASRARGEASRCTRRGVGRDSLGVTGVVWTS